MTPKVLEQNLDPSGTYTSRTPYNGNDVVTITLHYRTSIIYN